MPRLLMRVIGLCLALVAVAGCSVQRVNLAEVSAGSTLEPRVITSTPFPLMALAPSPGSLPRIRVYIEGDGHAWATSSQPSTDPTPRTSLVARYASLDRAPAIYLARPCQYLLVEGCNQVLWTDRRFSQEVIRSYSAALDLVKAQYQTSEFELVGYSGGAAIALLLAASRHDIASVQTIAGNVDTDAWAKVRGFASLEGSLNPADVAPQLTEMPQRHIVGLNDKVVPRQVIDSYLDKLGGRCVQVVRVEATHNVGFDSSWAYLSNQPIECRPDAP